MSLTSHLDSKDSEVREFLYQTAPNLANAARRGKEGRRLSQELGLIDISKSALTAPLPSSVQSRVSHASTVATAFDYRLRLILGQLELESTIAAMGLEHMPLLVTDSIKGRHRLDVLGEAFAHACSLIAGEGEEDLDRACVVLAWCDSLFRAGQAALDGSLGTRLDKARSGAALIAKLEDAMLEDLLALRTANWTQILAWKTAIAAGAQYVEGPVFTGSHMVGGADGDWIVGDTLIECKVTEKCFPSWIRDTIFQLLGYTVLDLDDEYHIRNVAIWLPRRSLYRVWPLERLLGDNPLKQLLRHRANFREMMADPLTASVNAHF